jgi:hypothetical protein
VDIKFKELIQELKMFMHNTFLAPKENLDGMEVVVLDSSKTTKFSKHCIIKIPGS